MSVGLSPAAHLLKNLVLFLMEVLQGNYAQGKQVKKNALKNVQSEENRSIDRSPSEEREAESSLPVQLAPYTRGN